MKLNNILVFVLILSLGACSKFGKVLKSKDFEYKLKMANTYFEKKEFRQAQVLYEELFPVFKGTPQFDDLYYNYAFSHYNMRDYETAFLYYNPFLEIREAYNLDIYKTEDIKETLDKSLAGSSNEVKTFGSEGQYKILTTYLLKESSSKETKIKVQDDLLKALSSFELKKDKNVAVLQSKRWNEILGRMILEGEQHELSEEFILRMFKAIHQESINHQEKILNP